jgi:hypothetical protein
MKVYDLRCSLGHRFEGWFSSDDDYLAQQHNGLLTCPMCDSPRIEKLPSAPRLNLSHAVAADQPPGTDAPPHNADSVAPATPSEPASVTQMQAMWLHMARHVMAHTEDVGKAFAEEARNMHRGDSPERPIRGQTTPQEARQLQEEGIEVMQLALPPLIKETLQ